MRISERMALLVRSSWPRDLWSAIGLVDDLVENTPAEASFIGDCRRYITLALAFDDVTHYPFLPSD